MTFLIPSTSCLYLKASLNSILTIHLKRFTTHSPPHLKYFKQVFSISVGSRFTMNYIITITLKSNLYLSIIKHCSVKNTEMTYKLKRNLYLEELMYCKKKKGFAKLCNSQRFQSFLVFFRKGC